MEPVEGTSKRAIEELVTALDEEPANERRIHVPRDSRESSKLVGDPFLESELLSVIERDSGGNFEG